VAFVIPGPSAAGPDKLNSTTVILTDAAESFMNQAAVRPVDFVKEKPTKVYDSFTIHAPAESLYQMPNGVIVRMGLTPGRALRYDACNPDGSPVIRLESTVFMEGMGGRGTPQPSTVILEDPSKSPKVKMQVPAPASRSL